MSPDRLRSAPLRTSRSSFVIFPSADIMRYIASQSGPYSAATAISSAASGLSLDASPRAIDGR